MIGCWMGGNHEDASRTQPPMPHSVQKEFPGAAASIGGTPLRCLASSTSERKASRKERYLFVFEYWIIYKLHIKQCGGL